MKKVFIWLWVVAGLFFLGFALIIVAAFTTHATSFSGQADLYLKFENEKHELLSPEIQDADGHAVKPESTGYYLVHPKFEARDTNIYDTLADNGPLPRTAIVAFNESGGKHHEVQFVYDRHGKVWQAIVSFPDPSIADVQVVNSSLDFKGLDGEADHQRRHFESTIYAKALVGAPIIKND